MSEHGFSEDSVARYWNDNAASWAQEVRKGNDVAREWLNNPAFLNFIGDLRGRQVLDAGCGEGHNARILARRGARMTGVDISGRMIELAREEEEREPLGISSEYVNDIIAAGFRITRMEEPRPSEEYCQAHPSQQGWRDHAALFLYVRAEKPAR